MVAERRILGQQAAVRIRCEHVTIARALRFVLAVVAVALQHISQRLHARAEIGFTGVILEADHIDARQLVAGEHVIADHALLAADGVEVERAGEVALHAIPRFVILPQHLIAAADRKKGLSVLDGRPDLLRFGPAQIRKKHLLLEILTAADEKQIICRRIERLADGHLRGHGFDSAPAQALLHAEDVSPVAVEIQDIGIKMTDPKFHIPPPYSQNSL